MQDAGDGQNKLKCNLRFPKIASQYRSASFDKGVILALGSGTTLAGFDHIDGRCCLLAPLIMDMLVIASSGFLITFSWLVKDFEGFDVAFERCKSLQRSL